MLTDGILDSYEMLELIAYAVGIYLFVTIGRAATNGRERELERLRAMHEQQQQFLDRK